MLSLAIQRASDLNAAIASTYICAGVVAVAFFVVLLIVANAIPWQKGTNDTSGASRRVAWIILAFIAFGVQVGFMFWSNYTGSGRAIQNQYVAHMWISGAVALVAYFIISLIAIKAQKSRSKLGSILNKN